MLLRRLGASASEHKRRAAALQFAQAARLISDIPVSCTGIAAPLKFRQDRVAGDAIEMLDRQNQGGRWLQRTADCGPDYSEPEYQYVPRDARVITAADLPIEGRPEHFVAIADAPSGDELIWPGPHLPNGAVVLHIVSDDADPALPIQDDWAGPDWVAGASLSDFVRYLSPDLRRRLDISRNSSPWGFPSRNQNIRYDQAGEHLGNLSDRLHEFVNLLRTRWPELSDESRSRRIRDFITHLVLEKTEPDQNFCLKYLRRSLDSDWKPLPQAWRDKLRRLGTLNNPGAPGRCLDPDCSTLEFRRRDL